MKASMNKRPSTMLKIAIVVGLLFVLTYIVYILGCNCTVNEICVEEKGFKIIIQEKLLPGYLLKLASVMPGDGATGSYDVIIIGNNGKRFGPFRVTHRSEIDANSLGISFYKQDVFIGIADLTQ